MNDPWVAAALAVAGTLVAIFLIAFVASGANLGRLLAGRRAFRRVLMNGQGADQIIAVLDAPPKPAGPPKPSGAPLRLLALLQREGRLIDFLLEDIQNADEVTIGAAVKEIQRQCNEVLKEHLVLEPESLASAEGSDVEVPAGFDPGAIRLTGNVTGEPPFKGTLQHHGWRVKEIKLGPVPEGQDEFVLAQAEVVLP